MATEEQEAQARPGAAGGGGGEPPQAGAGAVTEPPEEPQPEPIAEPVTPPQAGVSMLDQIKAKRAAIAQDTETLLDIPRYSGWLAARFRLLAFERVSQMAKLLQSPNKTPDQDLRVAAEFIAEACEEILARPGGEGEPQPIDPTAGVPTRFDEHLATLLEITLPPDAKARDVVRAVFNRDHTVIGMSNTLYNWMAGAQGQVNDSFLGE